MGRKDELAALIQWCKHDHAGRLRLATGPGGVGKTRLAVELSRQLREAGWEAHRIAIGKEATAITKLRERPRSLWLQTKRRRCALLVIDYAESRMGLGQLLTDLASKQGDDVWVLLLARHADGWWDQLGISDPAVWDLKQLATHKLIDLLPTVADDLTDADVIARAVRSFALELGRPEKTVEIQGSPGRRRVLDLHTAALVAVLDDEGSRTVKIDINNVLDELLRHETLLDRLHAAAVAQDRAGSLIEIGALRGLALAATGDEAGAVTALTGALRLACPQGHIRVFADEGPPMAALLGRLIAAQRAGQAAAGVPLGYLARLQRAFAAGPPAPDPGPSGIIEPLTRRELEVLRILAAGRSNQAIAGELVVTLDTVKKHVGHVLGKLGAANRTEAVARARELSLIP